MVGRPNLFWAEVATRFLRVVWKMFWDRVANSFWGRGGKYLGGIGVAKYFLKDDKIFRG